AYVRSSVMIIIGGVTALVGFALVNVAIAFLISRLFQNTSLSQPVRYGLGFAITGLIYLVVGTVLIIIHKNKLAAQDMMPARSINELKKDRAKIGSGLE
nr:phage holin family protein [Blastocatellia bacterium]